MQFDRHVAISGGWVAGPAFGLAMTALPAAYDFGPVVAKVVFWCGISIFLITIFVMYYVSRREKGRNRMETGPLILIIIGLIILGAGVAWNVWPKAKAIANNTPAQSDKPVNILSLFMTDFHPNNGFVWNANADIEIVFNSQKKITRIYYNIISDGESNVKFVAFYLPYLGDQTLSVIHFLSENYSGYMSDIESKTWGVIGSPALKDPVNTQKLIFSGRVYIYYEGSLSVEELGDLTKQFREHGAAVQFRSFDYLAAAIASIRNGTLKEPPIYEIRDGIPKVATISLPAPPLPTPAPPQPPAKK